MQPIQIICRVFQLLMISSIVLISCVEKDINPEDPAAAFSRARESYDDEMYEIAIQKLGEFKSRFPYSKHAPEAELMVANCHYQLGRYAEAASAYELFTKLHPKHEKADFAQFRIGESYWAEAPDSIDREQDFTLKSLVEWNKLIQDYPASEYVKAASTLLLEGQRRVAEHSNFIASFYCKQEIYHSCAYRYLEMVEQFPQFKDLVKISYLNASIAFHEMAKEKSKNQENDSNIYLKTMSTTELQKKSEELKAQAQDIDK